MPPRIHGDNVTALHTTGAKMMGELIRLFVELLVTPGETGAGNGESLGCGCGLALELIDDGSLPDRVQRNLRVRQDFGGAGCGQRKRIELFIGIGNEEFEQTLELPEEFPHAPGVEQPGVVHQSQLITFRKAAHVKREVKLRVARGSAQSVEAQAMRLGWRRLEIEHVEEHLEQRRAAEIARWIDLLHQFLERHLLMRVGPEADVAHAGEKFAHGRLAAGAPAQDERVHEQAGHALGFRKGAPRNRAADHEIILPGKPRQQGLEAGEQGHEERGSLLRSERAQGSRKLLRQQQLFFGAVKALHGGT